MSARSRDTAGDTVTDASRERVSHAGRQIGPSRQWSTIRWREVVREAAPVVLVVAALAAKLLYFYEYSNGSPGDASWWSGAARATAGSAGVLLILSAPVFLFPQGLRACMLALGDVVATLIILADVLYLRFFGDVLSVAALSAAHQVGTNMVLTSIGALLRPSDSLFFADLPLLAVLAVAGRRGPSRTPQRPAERPGVSLAAAALLVGIGLAAIPVRDIVRVGALDYYAYLKLRGAARIGLLNYHLYDIARAFYGTATRRRIGEPERMRVRAFLEERARVSPRPGPLFGVARGRNVIVVMVESLHAFPLGMRVAGREVTPNLNALARRSLTFENFYNQAWRGNTSDGEFAAFQSLHPLADGAVSLLVPTHRLRALPEILRERGYATLSAHAYDPALWMLGEMHRRYGFEQNFFQESFRPGETIGLGLSDREFLRQVAPMLERQRQPFMASLLTLSTHHPYPLPAMYRQLDLGALDRTIVGGYLQSVHYVDGAVGEFVQRLEADGLLDRSVLVLFGDHTANLGEKPDLDSVLVRYAGFPRRGPEFDFRYWREENRLPLLVHLPHDSAAGRRTTTGGQLDIAPTILGLLGMDRGAMLALGRDLVAESDSLVVFRDGGFVVGDTVCVAPSVLVRSFACRATRTGASLDPSLVHTRLEEARRRLEVSDIIIDGDLIPWASAVASESSAVLSGRQSRSRARPGILSRKSERTR